MADFAYSQAELDAAEEILPGRLQPIVNALGGVVSLVLIAGLVVWGWQLLVRDVSGVPVIEALEGPMRVEPAESGGVQRDHQGLAVNRISEGQEAAPAPDQIVLAPPPVELARLERPAAEPAAETAGASASVAANEPAAEDAEAPIPGDAVTEAVMPNPAEAPTPEAASAATLALIDQLMQAEQAAEDAPRIDVIPISVSGVRESRLPVLRPAALELAAVERTAAATPVAAPSEVDPAGLATGTRLVQLGAFDDAETARAEWTRLAAAFPDFFDSRERIVQQATSGGREFYRLRAYGFDDLMDARRFCTALLAEGAACIPVTVR